VNQALPADLHRPYAGSSGRLAISTVELVRNAMGLRSTVQVLLPDRNDRLRVLAHVGRPITAGRMRSSRRRQVYRTGQPMRLGLREPSGSALAMYPLIAEDRVFGVLEICAPDHLFAERAEIVDAVVGESAMVFRSLQDQRESEDELVAVASELRLAGELLRAATPASAVRSAVQAMFARLDGPVAGLLPDRSGSGWFVASALGLSPGRRAELRRSLEDVSVVARSERHLQRLADRFAAIVGRDEAQAIDARDALLLLVNAPSDGRGFLETTAVLLAEALDRIGLVGWAEVRNENLDLAIAWTAHELRGPIIGARAALDQVAVAEGDPDGRDLLRRTKVELERLADLVDPLLRWSAGTTPLRLRQADLVPIVKEAVETCCFEFPDGSYIDLRTPSSTDIRADRRELRGAVANVLRNALQHSPPDRSIDVRVEETDDAARILVRDRGPGIAAADRHLIFDPFARGRSANTRRFGRGLGLFIARRIVEAHGGTIGVRPIRPGAEFCIELPLGGGGRSAS